MDKPGVPMRKGQMFTIDALLALGLLLFSTTLLVLLVSRPSGVLPPLHPLANGAMDSMRTLTLENLSTNPRYPVASDIRSSGEVSGFNQTIAEAVADLYVQGQTDDAKRLAREFLNASVPSDTGIELLLEQPGTDCQGSPSAFSCIYDEDRARRSFVAVERHFVYYNDQTRELRLVLHK